MMEADRLLAERLQAREQGELTDEKKGKLFVELLEKRRKHFAALRAQEQRNIPPTKAQKKSQMSTYLKYMAGYKQSQLKKKSFAEIQRLFDKEMKRVNTFVAMDSEAVESSRKKDDSNDRDDVTIDAIPLFVKILIVDYKIHQEGKKSFFQIMRAVGKTQMYLTFSKMLKNFDREDLEVL
ncbi:hypothetical protein Tco_0883118 [Tanacetum coccineum]